MKWIAFRGRPSVEYHDVSHRIVVTLSVVILLARPVVLGPQKTANSSTANNASGDEDEDKTRRTPGRSSATRPSLPPSDMMDYHKAAARNWTPLHA